ncbi:hypothetical protein HYS31_06755 [Candidatus Woesearchaeota archaeon]|nr:hypothetical protein [Candidatus Woesearchaeota archaeon]
MRQINPYCEPACKQLNQLSVNDSLELDCRIEVGEADDEGLFLSSPKFLEGILAVTRNGDFTYSIAAQNSDVTLQVKAKHWAVYIGSSKGTHLYAEHFEKTFRLIGLMRAQEAHLYLLL